MLAEEDKNAEEKSPLDGAWYKRKHNNSGQRSKAKGQGQLNGSRFHNEMFFLLFSFQLFIIKYIY